MQIGPYLARPGCSDPGQCSASIPHAACSCAAHLHTCTALPVLQGRDSKGSVRACTYAGLQEVAEAELDLRAAATAGGTSLTKPCQLQPLQRHTSLPAHRAHQKLLQEVARTSAQLSWVGVHLLPLAEAGKAAGARRAQATMDPQQLVGQLQQLLGQNGGTHTQQTPLLLACLQVRSWAQK